MEVLELKPVKSKKIVAYMANKTKRNLESDDIKELIKFFKSKKVDFITIDYEVNLKEFSKRRLAQELDKLEIPYYQVKIPEYAMGYLYEEIVEKEELVNELLEEYQSMEDRDSFKGQSLKNWIDMLTIEIEEKEIFLSLILRPQWIVKKMLDLAKNCKKNEVSFVHLVPKDVCEDICTQVVEQLRALNVKVIQYTKKHTIKNIIF